MSYSDTLAGWHDFFVTCGAASATLVGLLFVGISLHVRVVATHVDVRRLARVTLSTFFTVVVIALVMLIPATTAAFTGLGLLVMAIAALFTVVPSIFEGVFTDRRRALPRGVVLGRFGLVLLTYLGVGGAGVLFLNGDYGDGLTALVSIVLLMLVVSVRNTWDLLVTLATK